MPDLPKAALPKLDFDPSKPYEHRPESAPEKTAATVPPPANNANKLRRPVAALLGGAAKK